MRRHLSHCNKCPEDRRPHPLHNTKGKLCPDCQKLFSAANYARHRKLFCLKVQIDEPIDNHHESSERENEAEVEIKQVSLTNQRVLEREIF